MLSSFSSAVALTTLLAAVSSVNAQARAPAAAAAPATASTGGATVQSPELIHCQTAALKYTCLAPPCMLALRPSNTTSDSYAIWYGLAEASGSVPWAPYVPGGANLTAYIYDAGGNPNYSGALIVGDSPSTCEENLGYTITDGVTSSAAPTGSGSQTSAASGKDAAATSAGAGKANATASAADAKGTGSGASKLAQGTTAFALLGAGAALLL